MGKLCARCGSETVYSMLDVPICFECICKMQNYSKIEIVIKKAEFVTGILFEQMKKRTRRQDVVDAKYYAMYLLRVEEKCSYYSIAELFGMDHSSIIYGVGRVKDMIRFNQLPYII